MAIVNDKIQDVYGLTPLQEGMLFQDLSDDDSTAYVVQTALRVNECIDIDMFKTALHLLSLRYDALRTMFVYEKLKEPKQIVLKERELECRVIDFSNENKADQKSKIDKLLLEDVNRKFDLKNDSLLRVTIILLNSETCITVWTIHHIIMDGWCNNMILGKFFDYYSRLNKGESEESLLNEIKEEISGGSLYSDYIKWLNNQDKEKAKNYWEKELEGYENNTEIKPINKPEIAVEEQVREVWGELAEEKTEKLKILADNIEATINTIAEITIGILLQKYSRSEDVVFGKVVSGRNAPINGIENIVGLFINTIPVRITADKNMTVRELIKKQQKKDVESTNYDYYSLAEIQENTILKSDLIKQTYAFENYLSGMDNDSKDNVEEKENSIVLESSREQTHYGLSFAAMEIDNKLSFKILYNPNQYRDLEVKLIMDKIIRISEQIALNPDCKLEDVEAISEEEKNIILNDFNNTKVEYEKDKTVISIFEEQVEKTPENKAVVYEGESLTYRELNNRANILAHKLRELGIKPDDFVAIISDRSLEMMQSILGVMKSGGAYVPIEPTYPEERIKFMLEDSNPKAILLYTEENINLEGINIPILNLAESDFFVGTTDNPEVINKPEDLIYCIYTSGTTGKPKGVMIQHDGISNLCSYYIKEYDVKETDRVLMFASFAFDSSVNEILTGVFSGAQLHIISNDLKGDISGFSNYLVDQGITLSLLPPGFLSQLEIKGVRTVITAGSEATHQVVEQNKNIPLLVNEYGPTEGTVCATLWKHAEGSIVPERIPIGKPIANKKIYIVQNNNLCGIGVPGELCIAGEGLARGYLNRPELTDEKFVKNPFGEGRMYHTGDLARWLSDGNIDYLGRIDEQVKIRGFRVELGEIESRIREIEGISDAAVIVRADDSGDMAICAYYVADSGEISIANIRETLSVNLPDYMIPAYIMKIEKIPVTRNGKLDKKALPEIEINTGREYIAPRNEIEEMVSEIWSDILNQDQISVCDMFYELGGNSIKAMKLINRVNQEMALSIKLSDFLRSKMTIEAMSLMVEDILMDTLSEDEIEYLNK